MKNERSFLVLLGLFTAFVLAGHFRPYYVTRGYIPNDFGAFYCGGKAVLHRADPYRVEPILSCERGLTKVDPRWQKIMSTSGVVPAPLPGYDFIFLAPFSALPVRLAVMILGVLLIAATLLTGYSLARMSALPFSAAFAVAFMGITYGASPLGQIAILAIAALAVAALLLRLGKQQWAACAAAAALIEPHLGIPVVVAMFIFVPRVRLTIALFVAGLALCAAAAVGTRGIAEYPAFLSLHARAEVSESYQYSLTWLMHALGASPKASLVWGSLSSLILFAVCIAVLSRNREGAVSSGAVILLPAAFAVFGGTFMHSSQITAALLAAVVLVQPPALLLTPMLGAALLTAPYSDIHTLAALPSLVLALLAAWCVTFFPEHVWNPGTAARKAFAVTLVGAAITALLFALRVVHPPETAPGISFVADPNAFASIGWGQMMDAEAAQDRTPLFYYLLLKMPAWVGVAMTLWLSSRTLLGHVEIPGVSLAETRRSAT